MINIPSVPAPTGRVAGTQIYICQGIPWDRQYKHVRLFGSKSAALSYCQTKSVYSTTSAKPVRNNSVKVPLFQGTVLDDCNYILYNNTQLEDFWIMGFITATNYISDNCTEIIFEVDVFQTYFYSCTLSQCYVKRHHWSRSADTIGANTLPEPVKLGTYKVYAKSTHLSLNNMKCALYHGGDYTYDYFGNVGGMFTGVKIKLGSISDIQVIMENIIADGKESIIALIQMVPDFCTSTATGKETTVSVSTCFNFTPRNNKLYTYPYCYLHVDNHQGNSKDYYWELSEGNSITIYSSGSFVGIPTVVTYPLNYNSQAQDDTNVIVTNNFPSCAFTGNAYAQWLNANQLNMGVSLQSQALSALTNVVTSTATGGALAGGTGAALGAAKGLISGGVSLFNTVATQEAADKTARNAPNTNHGSIAASCYNIVHNKNEIVQLSIGIDNESAQAVDNFLSIYGYATNQVVTPNLNTRNLWNYVETSECNVQGNVGYTVRETLNTIFNNGVFVWHTNDIGNFNIGGNG